MSDSLELLLKRRKGLLNLRCGQQEEQYVVTIGFPNLVLGGVPVGKVWESLGYSRTIQ